MDKKRYNTPEVKMRNLDLSHDMLQSSNDPNTINLDFNNAEEATGGYADSKAATTTSVWDE